MQRDPSSHKGENGKVAIIGGSRFIHGAPILSVLGAEASGVDLVFAAVPSIHAALVRQATYNVQVHPLHAEELNRRDVRNILELLASMDCAVIGPGIVLHDGVLEALEELIIGCPCPMVLDAGALQAETLRWAHNRPALLTPHRGELERMGIQPTDLATTAQSYGVAILLKGPTDLIASPTGVLAEMHGGNAGLTVGGTGDTLAGLAGGFLAQGYSAPDAAMQASKLIKRAADTLAEQRASYTAADVIDMIPTLLFAQQA